MYPKDYIDSFLEWFILSLEDHRVLRKKENIRQEMTHSFLETIQKPSYIEKGSIQCLIDGFKKERSTVLKRFSKLMASALPNGISKFIGNFKHIELNCSIP